MKTKTLRFSLTTILFASTVAISQATLTPIMTGLHSPRGLTVDADGTVYVAEAGKGGDASVTTGEGDVMFGLSGGVSMYRNGAQSRVVPFLPSFLTSENGQTESVGPTNVAVSNGRIYVTFGWAGGVADRQPFGPLGRLFGTLTAFPVDNINNYRVVGDLAAIETFANPDRGAIDSDPYGLFVRGGQAFVADAAGNDVIALGGWFPSVVTVLRDFKATAPNGDEIMAQQVPTCITQGPGGNLYVGILTGFPFPVGGARVYRIDQYGRRTVYARNLSSIIDIEFDKQGNLYVLQYSAPLLEGGPSSLIKIDRSGNRTTLFSDLNDVTGFALGKQGEIYLSSGAFAFDNGTVSLWTP